MTEQSNCLLTVITATYNRIGVLPRAVRSILSQSFQSFEYIIVDDGSTDGTDEYLKKLQTEENRVIVLSLGSNRGANSARNEAIQHARGDWVIFVDSDNELIEGALQKLHEIIGTFRTGIAMLNCSNLNGGCFSTPPIANISYVTFSEYLRGAWPGEYYPVVRRECLLRTPFIPGISGGERITWSLISKLEREVTFYPASVLIYHVDAADRLSNSFKDPYRVFVIFCYNLRLLFFDYLVHGPSKIFSILIRVLIYGAAALMRYVTR